MGNILMLITRASWSLARNYFKSITKNAKKIYENAEKYEMKYINKYI